jgi:hypothetical protein
MLTVKRYNATPGDTQEGEGVGDELLLGDTPGTESVGDGEGDGVAVGDTRVEGLSDG